MIVAGRGRTETRYVTVPTTDEEAEALKEAMRREAELNPQVAPYLSRIENVAGQILDGRKAARGSTPGEPRPGWKSD